MMTNGDQRFYNRRYYVSDLKTIWKHATFNYTLTLISDHISDRWSMSPIRAVLSNYIIRLSHSSIHVELRCIHSILHEGYIICSDLLHIFLFRMILYHCAPGIEQKLDIFWNIVAYILSLSYPPHRTFALGRWVVIHLYSYKCITY